MEKKKEEKRRRFHESLLKFHHPPSPPSPPPSIAPLQLDKEELLAMVSGDVYFDFDPDADKVEKESAPSDDGDCGPQMLTRAQRKRIRKRKLKEAASERRKTIGPLLPSVYQKNLEDGLSDDQKKLVEETCSNSVQKPTQD